MSDWYHRRKRDDYTAEGGLKLPGGDVWGWRGALTWESVGGRGTVFDEAAEALGAEAQQQYDLTAFIGGLRQSVDRWRELRDPASW